MGQFTFCLTWCGAVVCILIVFLLIYYFGMGYLTNYNRSPSKEPSDKGGKENKMEHFNMLITIYPSEKEKAEAVKHMHSHTRRNLAYEYQEYDFDDGANEMMEHKFFFTMFNTLVFLCAVLASCFMNFFWKHR